MKNTVKVAFEFRSDIVWEAVCAVAFAGSAVYTAISNESGIPVPSVSYAISPVWLSVLIPVVCIFALYAFTRLVSAKKAVRMAVCGAAAGLIAIRYSLNYLICSSDLITPGAFVLNAIVQLAFAAIVYAAIVLIPEKVSSKKC